MKNLHNIQSEIPEWVKRLTLAWRMQRGLSYKLRYKAHKGFSFDRRFQYQPEQWWHAAGWTGHMKKVNLNDFDRSMIIIE